MPDELMVTPIPMSGCPEADSNALAMRLQICCYRDPLLRQSYTQHFEETDGAPLGMSWQGTLEFMLQSAEQIRAFCKATLTAFAGREVKLRVRCGKKEISIETRNASLDQIEPLLKECVGLLK